MINKIGTILKKGFTWNKDQEKPKPRDPFDLPPEERNCNNCAFTKGDRNCLVDGMTQCFHGIMIKIERDKR